MAPLFTSPDEWRQLAPAGERAYLRQAIGYLVRAAPFGFGTLVLVFGATEPHWRSVPVLLTFAGSLASAAGLASLLFRREWRAAARAYGMIAPDPNGALSTSGPTAPRPNDIHVV